MILSKSDIYYEILNPLIILINFSFKTMNDNNCRGFWGFGVDGEAVLLTTKKTTTDEEQSPIQLVEEAPNPIQIGFGRFHTLLCNGMSWLM